MWEFYKNPLISGFVGFWEVYRLLFLINHILWHKMDLFAFFGAQGCHKITKWSVLIHRLSGREIKLCWNFILENNFWFFLDNLGYSENLPPNTKFVLVKNNVNNEVNYLSCEGEMGTKSFVLIRLSTSIFSWTSVNIRCPWTYQYNT